MANNKVQLANGTVLIDLTDTTAVASDVAQGKYFYTAGGVKTAGTASGGGSSTPYVLVTGEQDAGGGKIVHITGAVNQTISADAGGGDVDALSATVLLDISDLTVTAPHLEQGYTAVDSMGRPVVGSLIVSGDAPVLDSKTITENGTYNATDDDLDGYSSVIVNVPTGGTPDLQTKTVSFTPSETAQTQTVTPDTGNDGLSSVEVSVGAISSSYVGSGIDRRSSSDLTASGATVSVPAGYYAEAASKSIASGSASTPATTITANPSISVSSSGLITASVSESQSVTPSVSAGYVSSGTAGTVSVSGSNTEQLTTQAAQTLYPSTSDQTITSGKYLTGTQTIKGVAVSNTLTAENVKSGVTITIGDSADADRITSVTGTYTGGTSKNTQVVQSTTRTNSSTLTAIGSELTVSTSGKYDIYYTCFRTNTSSSYTWGTQLYIDGTAYGSENTTWTNNQQNTHLSNISLTAGQKLRVYGRETRGTSYYVCSTMLAIVEA